MTCICKTNSFEYPCASFIFLFLSIKRLGGVTLMRLFDDYKHMMTVLSTVRRLLRISV